MNIWTYDKLHLFILFIVPGFISIKTYELLIPGEGKESAKQIIDAITYSCINYTLLLFPIIKIEEHNIKSVYPNSYILFYIFVLLIAPIIIVLIWRKIRTSKFIQNKIPHPMTKPWDYVFSQRKPYWVKVTLKNGLVIGGLYSTNSFSSSAPAKEHIYLEQTWIINERGGFDRMKNNSAGIIILEDEISFLELRHYGD